MSWASKKVWTAESLTDAKLNADIADVLKQHYAWHENMATLINNTTSWSTASTTLVDWNGATPLDLKFEKLHASTALICLWYLTSYSTIDPSVVYFAVKIGLTSGWPTGTDYGNALPRRVNRANAHMVTAGGVEVTGLGVGEYTTRLRVRASVGNVFSLVDFATLHVIEVNQS